MNFSKLEYRNATKTCTQNNQNKKNWYICKKFIQWKNIFQEKSLHYIKKKIFKE